MRTVAIVQARLGSTRLPRKVLAEIGGRPMLDLVVTRTGRARTLAATWVATTDLAEDDAIADWCAAAGVPCARGPSLDVLARYVIAAQAGDADVIVRVTADCPLIDPGVIDAIVEARARAGADYAGNTITRTCPDGLDAEAFTRAALLRADAATAPDSFHRQHVTSFIYSRPDLFRLVDVALSPARPEVRWTVDTAADLTLARALYAALDNDDGADWRRALEVFDRDPALRALNAHVQTKALEEG